MIIYRFERHEARHRRNAGLLRAAAILGFAACAGGCSTPLSLPVKATSGFFDSDAVETTGSVNGVVTSETLPALLGAERWRHAKDAISLALKESEDGDTVSWRDEGQGGSITLLRGFTDNSGAHCRALALVDLESNAGELLYDACRSDNGVWSVEPALAAKS